MLTTEQVKQVLVSVPVDKNTDVIVRNKVLMTRPMVAGRLASPADLDTGGWTHHGHVHDMDGAVAVINEHFAAIGDPRADKNVRLGFRRDPSNPPHGQPGHVCGRGEPASPKFYGVHPGYMHKAAEIVEAIKLHLATGSPLPEGAEEVAADQIPEGFRAQLRAQGIPLDAGSAAADDDSSAGASILDEELVGPVTEQMVRDAANVILQAHSMDDVPQHILDTLPPELAAALQDGTAKSLGLPAGLFLVIGTEVDEDKCNCGDCIVGRLYGYTWATPYEELRFRSLKLIVDERGPQVGLPCWKGKPKPEVCAGCGKVHGGSFHQQQGSKQVPIHPFAVIKGPQGVQ